VKRRADFERPALAHAATPAGPLTSTKGFIKRRMFNRIGVGDELPNSFLERRRLGRPLPCAIRLRAQRSDHMAVGVWSREYRSVEVFEATGRGGC
jgi:hypothetical protein